MLYVIITSFIYIFNINNMYMKFNLKIIGTLIILAIVILSLTLLFNYKNCKKCKKNIKEGMNVNGMVDENKNAYLDTIEYSRDFMAEMGTYKEVNVYGGSGNGMEVYIDINNYNKVTSLNIVNVGSNYKKNDVIKVSGDNLRYTTTNSGGYFTFKLLDTMPSFLTFNTFGNSKTGKVTSDVVINKAAFVTDYYTPI